MYWNILKKRLNSKTGRIILTISAGFILAILCYTFTEPLFVWDTPYHYQRSQWLISKYFGVGDTNTISDMLKWYGPLWEFLLGFFSEIIFSWLNDPLRVRTAVSIFSYFLALWSIFKLLLKIKIEPSTAFLAVSMITSYIRLGGHALFNSVDYPFAMIYLITTLSIWIIFERLHRLDRQKQGLESRWILALSALSLCPYLVRPPVMAHFIFLFCFLFFYYSFVLHPPYKTYRWKKPLHFLLVGFFLLWMVWPSIWEIGFRGWLSWFHSFSGFSNFPWTGQIRLFGKTYQAGQLPRLYPLYWLGVGIHPLGILGILVGLPLLFWSAQQNQKKLALWLDSSFGKFNLSFTRWMILWTLIAWSGVLVLKPNLYDEDRHLLFLVPPLLLLAALGFDFFKPWIRWTFSAVILSYSLFSYAKWGIYSYIYIQPLLPYRSSEFMGDYWGACLRDMMSAYSQHRKNNEGLVIPWIGDAAQLAARRLQISHFKSFHETKERPVFYGAFGRMNFQEKVISDIHSGQASEIWHSNLPGLTEKSCVLAYYP